MAALPASQQCIVDRIVETKFKGGSVARQAAQQVEPCEHFHDAAGGDAWPESLILRYIMTLTIRMRTIEQLCLSICIDALGICPGDPRCNAWLPLAGAARSA